MFRSTLAGCIFVSTIGCGNKKAPTPHYEILFTPAPNAAGPEGASSYLVRLQFGEPGDSSWGGRTFKVTIRPEEGLVVDPAEANVTLNPTGQGELILTCTPPNSATGNLQYPVTVTVTGPENFSASVPGNVTVWKPK